MTVVLAGCSSGNNGDDNKHTENKISGDSVAVKTATESPEINKTCQTELATVEYSLDSTFHTQRYWWGEENTSVKRYADVRQSESSKSGYITIMFTVYNESEEDFEFLKKIDTEFELERFFPTTLQPLHENGKLNVKPGSSYSFTRDLSIDSLNDASKPHRFILYRIDGKERKTMYTNTIKFRIRSSGSDSVSLDSVSP